MVIGLLSLAYNQAVIPLNVGEGGGCDRVFNNQKKLKKILPRGMKYDM
jgi:hypothetical protein